MVSRDGYSDPYGSASAIETRARSSSEIRFAFPHARSPQHAQAQPHARLIERETAWERELRRRRAAHARIGVLAFLLILAVVVIQQAVAGDGGGPGDQPREHASLPGIASASPSPSATPPAATATPSPAATQPVRSLAPAPTPPAVIPTVTPTLTPAIVEPADDIVVVEPDTALVDATATVEDDTAAVEDVAEPTADSEFEQQPEPAQGATSASLLGDEWEYAIHTWDGGVMGLVMSAELNVRAAPAVDAEIVDTTWMWRPVVVYDAVYGDWVGETDIWYAIGVGQFVSAAFIDPFVPTMPENLHAGAWVDVNLSTGYAVAWQDDVPVYAALVAYGKPGFETPLGVHTIFERRETDTLDSTTTGIPAGDAESYYLTDVPYVQYFAQGGFALHANTWDEPWELGGPTSHGCVNLTLEDAAFFWNFLDVDSVVSVHE